MDEPSKFAVHAACREGKRESPSSNTPSKPIPIHKMADTPMSSLDRSVVAACECSHHAIVICSALTRKPFVPIRQNH